MDANECSIVIPSVVLASINAYNLWTEHWEHWSHMPPLEERVEYPYQNIRTKNFFWGDGDKVCSTSGEGFFNSKRLTAFSLQTLFWNDKVNYHNKDKVA